MAGEDVRELLIRVNATTELLRSNLTAAERAVADFERDTNKRLDKVDGNFGRLGAGVDRLKVGFASAASASAGFIGALGVGSILAAGRAVLDFADNLDAAAEKAGVSVERYQTLKEGLRALEVSGEQTDKILKTLTDTLGAVQSGTASKSLTESLDRLGVTQDILNGKIKDAGGLLDAIAKGSDRYATSAQFTSDVVNILGRKIGVDLAAAIKDAGVRLHELEDGMRSAGTVITEEMVKKLADANEAIDAFKTRSAQTLTIWTGETLDYFGRVLDGLQRLELRYRNFLGSDTGDLQGKIDAYTASQANESGISRQRDRVNSARQQVGTAKGVADFLGGGGVIGRMAVGDANDALAREEARLQELINARTSRGLDELWSGGLFGRGSSSSPTSFPPPKTPGPKSSSGKTAEDPIAAMMDSVDISIRNWRDAGKSLYDQLKIDEGDLLDKQLQGIEIRHDADVQARLDAFEQANRAEQENIRTLTDLFEDGMRGGTKAIWDNFEAMGIRALASLAAQFVASKIAGKGGFDFGGALTTALGFGGFFADGGNPPVGKASIVGERGPEIFVPKVPGTIIPNGGMGGVSNHFDLRGAVVTEALYQEMQSIATATVGRAAGPMIDLAQQRTMRTLTRPALGRS